MIYISFKENALIIPDVKQNLSAEQISQLVWFGLKRHPDNSSILFNQVSEEIFLKIIDYLETEKVKFALSNDVKNILERIRLSEDHFRDRSKMAQEFKDGKLRSEEIKQFCQFVSKLPRKFKVHQIKAACHLYLLKDSANFSVPGSGKTSVVLAVYEKLRVEKKVNVLFVVGPPSCFGPWRKEFEATLGRKPKVKILSGIGQKHRMNIYWDYPENAELCLTTFQTLLNDSLAVKQFFKRKNIDIFLVIDEAHYIKQVGGNWAKAVLDISSLAKCKCVLTGTPMPRSYTDVFNMFDFLYGKYSPFSLQEKIKVQWLEKKKDDEKIRNMLDQKIGPLFYRVRKRDLGLLPQIFHPERLIKMNKYEELIYKAIENKILNYSKDAFLNNIETIMQLRKGRIIRLRQCVSYAGLLAKPIEDYPENLIKGEINLRKIILNYDKLEKPAKLELLLEMVKKFNSDKEKVIVWVNFIGTLELLRKALLKSGIICEKIYGATPVENEKLENAITREKIIDKFKKQNSGLDVLLLNPAACAESISLHQTCFRAIYYDLSYNCAQYLQSLDRIHRVGGSEHKTAHYYFLQYKNTIDEDIKSNLDKKVIRMNKIFEKDYCIYSLDMFEEDGDLAAYERLFGQRKQTIRKN
ncbi:MAG: DEAD/DEAH box helicase [Candidatus Omnitrophica bacterium]|nr:DEAD/DEAH box helicase [Candidatus Omnitrophota bacterium]